MTRSALLAALGGILVAALAAAQEPAIVPNPASLTRQPGEFRLTTATPIVAASPQARHAAATLAELVRRTNGMKLRTRSGPAQQGAINLVFDASALPGSEAYRLEVRKGRVTITASSAAGLFYGGTTLTQLLEPGTRATASIPALDISDAPRFAWRGIMLDSARHFQSPEFIRRFIDAMAMHKLNVLHWHLTDDQAWRLEIRKYPKLTQVGAWRVPAGAAREDIDPATGKPRLYGGFYSQETVRELVRYAADRGITIVPEIEMPGHASAALAAYPQLAATDHPPREVPADWGIYPNAYSLDEGTFAFLEDVLTEVMALFPSRYIHVGGDEVEKTQWKESARGQALMRELGTQDPARLQVLSRSASRASWMRTAGAWSAGTRSSSRTSRLRGGDVVARRRRRAQGGRAGARHGARGASHALLRQSPGRGGRRASRARARGLPRGRLRLRADARPSSRPRSSAMCWACRATCGPSTSVPRSASAG